MSDSEFQRLGQKPPRPYLNCGICFLLVVILCLVTWMAIEIADWNANEASFVRVPLAPWPEPAKQCDIAIIGAGPGGLWTALRLKLARPNDIVCVFEALDVVGGRVKSSSFDGAPSVAIELGGMQVQLRAHPMVTSALRFYNLTLFPRKYDPNNFNFLRNRRHFYTCWADGTSGYFFDAWEQKLLNSTQGDPSEFLRPIFDNAQLDVSTAAAWDACQWDEWRKTGLWQEQQLVHQTGWWLALQQILSDEAIAGYRDASGYDSFVQESNLADVLSLVFLGFNESGWETEYRIKEGFQELFYRMAAEFESAGGLIYYNFELLRTQSTNRNSVLLEFANLVPFEAKSVVYALTQPALRKIASRSWNGVLSTDPTRADIDSVMAVPAFKMFLAFDTSWWRAYNFTDGVMYTSSPARKLYYWGTERDFSHADNDNSVLLATYEDDQASLFWRNMLETQEMGEPFYFHPNPHLQHAHVYLNINSTDPRSVMVRELMDEIRRAHYDIEVPDPYAAVFMDWARAPPETAWHAWKIGVVSSEVRQRLRKPRGNDREYVCGEAYSDNQGWTEGAFRSCEKMLIDYFGLQSEWKDHLECA